MNLIAIRTTTVQGFSRWIDAVAEFVATVVNRFAAPRVVKLVETDSGEFTLDTPSDRFDGNATPRIRIVDGRLVDAVSEPVTATLRGSRIEMRLRPDHFLFCPIELPGRASEFLDGVVRSQIDRLTPWSPAEAAFGWSQPKEAENDRIALTIAATDRALVAPYVDAVAGLGAQSVVVFTTAPEAGDASIKVAEERAGRALDAGKIRHVLVIVLMAAAAIAAAALGGSRLAQINLDAQQAELDFRIAKFRAAIGASGGGSSASLATAQRLLEKRKLSAPPSVIIIEALSRILPDDTYVTDLRVEGNKIQLEGATRNAAALIGLIEQSGLFAKATFFAPTTRSTSEAVERFHIEALIQSGVARS